MCPETQKRPYELRRRAEKMAATRQRITQAAVDLHGSIGPARTTITAVADRAGVQRHTVYRHFPTEDDLFAACSRHYFAGHPWPDPVEWRAIADPAQRLAHGLDELYAYYERTEAMLASVLRDAALVPGLEPTLAGFRAFVDNAAGALAAGWGARGRGGRWSRLPRAMLSTSPRGAPWPARAASAGSGRSSSRRRWSCAPPGARRLRARPGPARRRRRAGRARRRTSHTSVGA